MDSTAGDSRIRRVGWLFDSRSKFDPGEMIRVLSGLGSVLSDEGCQVEPIEIMDLGKFEATLRNFFVRRMRKKKPAFTRTTPNLPVTDLTEVTDSPVKVLPTRVFSWAGISDASLSYYLSCYAQLSHTDLLIAPSGLRKKFLHRFRPSFSAALSAESKVPVLVVGSEVKSEKPIRRILFPVIDPDENDTGFQNLLEFAQLSAAKITVLYRHSHEFANGSWSPVEQTQIGSVPFYDPEVMQAENLRLKRISAWISRAKQQGITVDLKLGTGSAGFTETILKHQKKFKYDLIAIDPSYLGPTHLRVDLFRAAHAARCPVFVPHPVGQSSTKEFLRKSLIRLAQH